MTEFEEASAKYQKATEAYWRAEGALAEARTLMTIAERERRAAFDREIAAARSRSAVGSSGHSGNSTSGTPGASSQDPDSGSATTGGNE